MSKRKAEETNGSPTKKANSLDDFTSIFDELIADVIAHLPKVTHSEVCFYALTSSTIHAILDRA
jgi:hypothetical protein